MQPGCQAVGWACAVLNPSGTLITSAYGVPPKTDDTIQGAELWAVQMALSNAAFPDRLYTDCDSIRSGSSKSASWAQSSKRRYARVWSVIKSQLDDTDECVHWMPKHTSKSAIGQRVSSDGRYMTEATYAVCQPNCRYALQGRC